MKSYRSQPANRADVWKSNIWFALIAAAVVLIVLKMLTGIILMAAFVVAVVIFLVALGLLMRMSPPRRS